MDSQLLDKEGTHPLSLEIAVIHPVVGADDLVGELGVADQLVAAVALELEEELLHPFLFVDIDEVLFEPWTLVLHRLAVHITEDELQELPNAVDVAPMDTSDTQLFNA